MGESSAPLSESLFAQMVVEQGLATPEHVRECLDIIASLAERHVVPLPRLGELLVRKGYLSPQNLEATLRVSPRPSGGSAPSAGPVPLPAEVAEAAEVPGNRIGKYVRVKAIGAGGMGEVWSGWDTELRRWVALKFLNSHNRDEIARFEREAQTAAKLSHPNIAAVYDVGDAGGRPYIALQLIRGRTLGVFPRTRPRVLVEFLRQAALAVHYAHGEGVVHRDLKPQNIMVEGKISARPEASEYRVFVMDFGLAKEATSDSSLSVSGSVLGTPSYMPPEQARGQLDKVDGRSDVYSLGATLYELLTGKPPFKSQSVYEILKQVMEEDPTPPRAINPAIDGDLETVVLKCLEKDRARRYPTAKDLGEDLGRYLAGEPVVAQPASMSYRLKKWVGRRKAVAVAVVTAVLAAIAVAAILTGGAVGRAREARELKEEAGRTFAAKDWTKTTELLGRYLALRPDDVEAAQQKKACEHQLDLVRGEAQSKVRVMEAAGLSQKALSLVKEGKTLWRVRTARPEQWEKLFGDALGFARDALAKDDTQPGNHCTLGEILEAQGNWPEAIASYDRALKIDPAYADAWQRRGICYLEMFSEAMMDAQWRSTRAEEVLAILLNPGPRAVECRKNAIDSLKRYSEIKHDAAGSVEYRYTQVAASIVGGRFVEADQASDKLLAEVQTDERVWLLKAASQIGRMNFAGAATTLTKLIDDVAPQLWRPYFFRAWIRLVNKDWDRCIADCTRSLELDPRQARVYVVRASAKLSKSDLAGATADYDAALKYAPKWGFVWTVRAGAKLRMQDDRGAIEDATRAMELEPNDPSAPLIRSQAKWRLKDTAGAVEDAGLVIKINPKDVDAYIWRSHIRFTAGDWAGGIQDASKLTELEPKDGRHWYRRGKLWLTQKEYRKALEDFRKATELTPGLASEVDPLIAQCKAKLGE